MPETLIKVDLSKSAYDNDKIHNRWHPDIPIVAWVKPGDDFIGRDGYVEAVQHFALAVSDVKIRDSQHRCVP